MFRWDDAEAFDDDVVNLGNEAYGALCRGRKHCAHKLTDGVISRALALLIAPAAVWDLIAAPLNPDGSPRFIEMLDRGAIRFVGFHTWNRTAAEAKELHEKRAEVGRSGGLQSGKHRAAAKAHPEGPSKQLLEQTVTKPPANDEAIAEAKLNQGVKQSGTGNGSGSASGSGSDAREGPSADEVAIALQMRQHAIYRPLDAHQLAPVLVMRMFQHKKKLAWVLEAIDDCAAKSVGLGLKPEALQSKLVGFIRNASEPPADRASEREQKSGPAYAENDDEAAVRRIRNMPRRMTAQDAPASLADIVPTKAAGGGKGGGG